MLIERYQIGSDTIIKSEVNPETVALILESFASSDEANRSWVTLEKTSELNAATSACNHPAAANDFVKCEKRTTAARRALHC